ncbi:MAG: ribose 5-phosphate isomerase B [Ruminococcaceae bacterium]|nr:ribose 5-phosphate isomerase B [Oscillospiraceae bacterium]
MIAIGSDHGGFELKQHIMKHLDELGVAYKDFGTYTEDSVDYPDIAKAVAEPIAAGEYEKGILICGTGIGISIAANKIHGIRAALCCDVYSAKMCRQHNDANILCLGGRVTGRELAFLIVDTYLDETFAGDRHQNRINKIHALEK